MRTLRPQRAFTIVEMLVAITVTVLLLGMIYQLFINTTRAVSTGIQTGEILVESESIGNQFRRDAEAMVPPSSSGEAGFLVIVQREINADMRNGDLPDKSVTIRSDQLVFIRGRQDSNRAIHALTPKHQQTLTSDIEAEHARVWYGHVRRTMPNGGSASSLGNDGSPNQYANDWVLGRQSLLLAEDGGGGNFAKGDTPAPTHAEDAQWQAPVHNTGATSAIASPLMYHGVTDVADQVLRNSVSPLGVLEEIENDSYPEAVYPYAVPENRPWVNPDPTSGHFDAWRVAQMHTYLTGRMSDFIVEFAGDYEAPLDGEIDRDTDGSIKWYTHDAFANNATETTDYSADPPPDGKGPMYPTTWEATGANLETGSPNQAHYETGADIPAEFSDVADAIFVFDHRDDQPFASGPLNSKWPYLIRIRYRLHDGRGRIGSHRFSTPADGDFENADVADEATLGRWFEHVISVQRPQP